MVPRRINGERMFFPSNVAGAMGYATGAVGVCPSLPDAVIGVAQWPHHVQSHQQCVRGLVGPQPRQPWVFCCCTWASLCMYWYHMGLLSTGPWILYEKRCVDMSIWFTCALCRTFYTYVFSYMFTWATTIFEAYIDFFPLVVCSAPRTHFIGEHTILLEKR